MLSQTLVASAWLIIQGVKKNLTLKAPPFFKSLVKVMQIIFYNLKSVIN